MGDTSLESNPGLYEYKIVTGVTIALGSLLIVIIISACLFCHNRIFRECVQRICPSKLSLFHTSYFPFLLYHEDDQAWVRDELLQRIADLIEFPNCSKTIPDSGGLKYLLSRVSYLDSVEPTVLQTRAVIVVVSNSFLASEWCTNPDGLHRLDRFLGSKFNKSVFINKIQPVEDEMFQEFGYLMQDVPDSLRKMITGWRPCVDWPNPADNDDEKEAFWGRLREVLKSCCEYQGSVESSIHSTDSDDGYHNILYG